jgi:hypothetical protein
VRCQAAWTVMVASCPVNPERPHRPIGAFGNRRYRALPV